MRWVRREGLHGQNGSCISQFCERSEDVCENQAPATEFQSTIALDPGVRTFHTKYDADGFGIEWGQPDLQKIFVLSRLADKIQSKISKTKATWSLRQAYLRKLRKIKDRVKEYQNKLALFSLWELPCYSRPQMQGVDGGEKCKSKTSNQNRATKVMLVA